VSRTIRLVLSPHVAWSPSPPSSQNGIPSPYGRTSPPGHKLASHAPRGSDGSLPARLARRSWARRALSFGRAAQRTSPARVVGVLGPALDELQHVPIANEQRVAPPILGQSSIVNVPPHHIAPTAQQRPYLRGPQRYVLVGRERARGMLLDRWGGGGRKWELGAAHGRGSGLGR